MNNKNELALIEDRLNSIDITRIADYTSKIGNISNLSQGASTLYLQDFIVAFDLTSNALSRAVRCESEAKSLLESARSEAYFDRASIFLTERKIKDTSEARKKYEEIDAEVIKAKDIYNRSSATVTLLKNKVMAFRYAYEAIKKVYFNNSGNDGMPFEGM